MRGTRNDLANVCLSHRIIPAHAGNSPAVGLAVEPPERPDHPRACGELFRFALMIPHDRHPDHPRACGELLPPLVAEHHDDDGSSPRMRGTQVRRPCTESRRSKSDHPRACGELAPLTGRWALHRGSSPRMRGTLVRAHLSRRRVRIIPAHAGNSGSIFSVVTAASDHPRACGELANRSSPPTLLGRIIPAHAGNSSTPYGRDGVYSPDHPRACGELVTIDREPGVDLGRIIPAHAGNSSQPTLFARHPASFGSSPRMRGTRGLPCALLA